MKTEPMTVTTQDRPATWEEIRRATSSSLGRVYDGCCSDGEFCEVDSDLGGVIRYPSKEFEFFAYLSEMDDNCAN